jgi:hypothetical protein
MDAFELRAGKLANYVLRNQPEWTPVKIKKR